MRGISFDDHDPRAHRNFLSFNSHFFCPLFKRASQCPCRLIADKEKGAFGIRKIVPFVVKNSPAIRHSRSRHDNFWIFHILDRHRISAVGREFEHGEIEYIVPCAYFVGGILIKILFISLVDLRNLYGERRVEKNGNFRDAVVFNKFVKFK